MSASQEHGAETAAGGHGAEQGSVPPSQVFNHLLGGLGDHHGFYIGPYHIADLPVIIVEDGVHFYSSPAKVNEAGKFKMVAGHPVKAGTGEKVLWDLSVTNFVMFEWMAIFVLLVGFITAGRRYKKNPLKPPRGIQNLLETIVVFIRDEIVVPNISSARVARNLTPYFICIFFFILMMNLLGLMPGGHSASGAIGVTGALALTVFIVTNVTAIKNAGVKHWLHHLLGGAPLFLAPIMVPIEIVGLFTKPFALTIRLFANMSAGHIVLVSLVGLIFFFKTIAVAPVSVGFSVFIYFLETLVCFLQAYIFTMLGAVFVGMALGDHPDDEHDAVAHA